MCWQLAEHCTPCHSQTCLPLHSSSCELRDIDFFNYSINRLLWRQKKRENDGFSAWYSVNPSNFINKRHYYQEIPPEPWGFAQDPTRGAVPPGPPPPAGKVWSKQLWVFDFCDQIASSKITALHVYFLFACLDETLAWFIHNFHISFSDQFAHCRIWPPAMQLPDTKGRVVRDADHYLAHTPGWVRFTCEQRYLTYLPAVCKATFLWRIF